MCFKVKLCTCKYWNGYVALHEVLKNTCFTHLPFCVYKKDEKIFPHCILKPVLIKFEKKTSGGVLQRSYSAKNLFWEISQN